jgi:glycosyltransferase involved in cell wall biosynthesis
MSAKIAINGRFLTQVQKGVQRFATQTTRAIDRLLDTADYAELRGHIRLIAPSGAPDPKLRHIALEHCGFMQGYAWEQLEFPLHARGHLLLNLCLLGPIATKHQVIVAHDATVRAMPENFSWKFRAAYDFLVPRLLRSDAVATVSDFSRREIAKYYGADPARMVVCYEGADHITSQEADRSILERLGIVGRSYFLGVGVDSPNKNIESVVAAFNRVQLGDTLLVLTGKRDQAVHAYSLQIDDDRARMVGHVSDRELRALYENALALVYPSHYEGFGLPPIEAMRCGCPVIVSNQPALVEIGGDAVLRCDADDVESLSKLLLAVHSDPSLRDRLIAAGYERVKSFTWDRTARILLDLCVATARRVAR